MTAVLEIQGLTKTYRGRVRANDGVSLSADAGQVYGVLGHNGAGKTTILNQVVGLLKPDAGSIAIHGHDVIADPGYARRACSVEAQSQVPIDGMTARQAIVLIGQLRGGSSRDVRRRGDELIAALDIGEWADVDGGRLSGGVKRLVSFCMAAVTPGRVVILDEPTNDVDPVRRRLLWREVRALADGGAAVLLITHNVIEAERSVDRLGILDHGRVIVEGTPGQLKEAVSRDLRIELVVEAAVEAPVLPPFIGRVSRVGDRILGTVPADTAGAAASWAAQLRQTGVLEEFSLAPATLEDVYVDIVGRADRERASGGDPASAARQLEAVDVRPA